MGRKRIFPLLFVLPALLVSCSILTSDSSSSLNPSPAEEPTIWYEKLEGLVCHFIFERGEPLYSILPIAGLEDVIILSTGSFVDEKNIASYYKYDVKDESLMFLFTSPASTIWAGMDQDGFLVVATEETVYYFRDDQLAETIDVPTDRRFDIQFDPAHDAMTWCDELFNMHYGSIRTGESRIIWDSTLVKNASPYPDVDDQGNMVGSRGMAPIFSPDGTFIFFYHKYDGYEVKPTFYNLLDDNYVQAESYWRPAITLHALNARGFITCYQEETKIPEGFSAVSVIDSHSVTEVPLDNIYDRSYSCRNGLLLFKLDEELHILDATLEKDIVIYADAPGRILVDAFATEEYVFLQVYVSRKGELVILENPYGDRAE